MNNKFTNALINESSPYLLQHSHNPVNWYPWGEEALSLAKEKELPILVSIGYSACHWCHVMERESFENEEVADYMNHHFVNIKIDREERPDLDHLYMDALQAISGSGGWPLNVFLTTEGKPFYGGTYFPPQNAYNRKSWSEVLFSIQNLWINNREEIERQAESLTEHLKKSNSFGSLENIIPAAEKTSFFHPDNCKAIASNILKNSDTKDGGFGKAPKFLQTFSLQYLLQYAHLFVDEAAKSQALFTLRKMLNGGIYDQLGGGISRYSTDNEWLVPHFEKMLYDNALFASVLCDAFQISREKVFEEGIRNTLHFFLDEMKHPEGGFYTALDADSEGVEGKFYVWDKKEIEEILGEEAGIFCNYFNVNNEGNWEGKNILNITSTLDDLALNHKISKEHIEKIINNSRKLLLAARSQRVKPGTDDKILLGCNALLLSAFCKAYAALGDEIYKIAAIELYEFIEIKFSDPLNTGGLLHTYKNNKARYPAFLDDYAYLIQASINLQEITSNEQYLYKARQLTQYVLENFSDEKSSFLFYTNKFQKDIVVRKIEIYDGATPSANSIMANNLLYLAIVFDDQNFKVKGMEMLQSVYSALLKYPSSFGVWSCTYLLQTAGINEISLTGKKIGPYLDEILKAYIPNKVLQSSQVEKQMPLLMQKAYKNDASIYLCINYSCKKPFNDVSTLLKSIKNI